MTTYRSNISKKAMITTMIEEGYITEAQRVLFAHRTKEDTKRCFNNMIWWKEHLNKTNFFIIECSFCEGVWEHFHRQDVRAYSEEEALAEVKGWLTGYEKYECVYAEDYDYRAIHF